MKKSEFKKIYDYLMNEFAYDIITWELSKSEKTLYITYRDINNMETISKIKVSDISSK